MIEHLYTKSDIDDVDAMDRQKSGNLHIQFTVADEVNGKRISGLTSAIIIEKPATNTTRVRTPSAPSSSSPSTPARSSCSI